MDWSAFRDASIDEVRLVAPRTVILASAGTRREGRLQGFRPTSLDDFFRWSLQAGHDLYTRWFDHGVQDLFTCFIRSTQVRERGVYGGGLIPFAIKLLTELADTWSQTPPPFAVRTFGESDFPDLIEPLARIRSVTARPGLPRMWWTFLATVESSYLHALAALAGKGVRTQADAICAIYGPEVAPCRLYVGFGKPLLTAELQLPFLIDEAQAMWYQRPGYGGLAPFVIRRMIYEAAYLRSTWVEDKGSRYEAVLDHRSTWERPIVLGFGRSLGGFWYPASDALCEEKR